ncbi:unnamed protein product [Anisakis simplex]|uniref:Signal transducing adapter molecule 1 (inferred by orthology to a C. elegans protein) n=1 Tax=Anisakis simplex TaxID=6269 RepID=A0A0M3KBZ4_ANISI|nr:unnamed protein product [Anisakis simplex]
MPLFGEAASPYDDVIEKVTAETCTSENWTLIVDICDKVAAEQSKGAKMCLLSIKKRLNHRDPHVVLLALSVLDSLWSNCGVHFRREVSSREFSQELASKATHSNRSVGEKTRLMLKKWAENECKTDASLGLIESLYNNLVAEGHSFESDTPSSKMKVSILCKVIAIKTLIYFQTLSSDPNVVQSAEEEEALARAIALSLDDTSRNCSIYPSTINNVQNNGSTSNKCVERDVRALYDFEAAEDNELTFVTGDIITVLDDSDQNWWKGRSSRGEGLFPSSFVTSQLNPSPEPAANPDDNADDDKQSQQQQPVRVARIDESVLLECLRLLEDCDPTGERPDPPELAEAEINSHAQVILRTESA